MNHWRKQSSIVLGVSLLAAIIVLCQMALYVVHLLWGVSLHKNVFEFCIGLFRPNSVPYYVITFILNALIVFTLITIMVKAVQQFLLLRKFKKDLVSLVDPQLSDKLSRQLNRTANKLIVVNHDRLLAFTVGFRNPRIVISGALLDMLEEQELRAVVEHETFHQINRDGIKIFITQLVSQALWFIPITRWCYQNYKIMSELAADEYAIHRSGSEIGLGSAMVKLLRREYKSKSLPVLVHFADGSINYRLKQLLNSDRSIPVKLDMVSMVTSIHMLMFVLILMIAAGM
ncbi:M56 family metallopeptidase [Cohnella mopanensis]|uniref:M56 family metallopeptidase n=1 Tax=Cohnella mopanensis TaxID=2911966 RepID=UPI001EF9543F|nr:M56 family metallopeptidase [Cohnella mopanensis]